jgi:hypothetical protein
MTDRVHALTVILDHDVRVDDVEALEGAILQLRGVRAVERHISNAALATAQLRTVQEVTGKLRAVIDDLWKWGRSA